MKHTHSIKTINEDSSGIMEICVECKQRFYYKKDSSGRVDNRKYLKDHERDFAQPTGTTGKVFKKHYGKAAN